MDITALIIGLILAAGLIIYIGRPLRRGRRPGTTESQVDALLAQRESLLTQIRELDFDHATGKVSDADHAPLRTQLVAEAAEVFRKLDANAPPGPASDDAFEAAVAARRKQSPQKESTADADLETAIASRRKRLTCPNCGKPFQPGDAFCAKCGATLSTQAAR